jgi:hypothetical protein
MSTVCPACGVAVVPGYVRCPKCHAGLSLGRVKRTTIDPGGTAVPRTGFPLAALLVALGVAAAIILLFGMRGTARKAAEAPPPPAEPIEATAIRPAPRGPLAPAVAPAPTAAAPAAAVPDLGAAVSDLEDTLHRQRLWGRVEILGQRIDVRSGSCADPAMRPLIDGKTTLLHGAGLTKLRCVEQSGAVVFERDL